LVLWEAQFGDFVNGGQVMIDQFISSGESKWKRQSGLVMLLPHGYDGMGPEHSSARPERFLQLCHSDPDIIPTDLPEKVIQQANLQVVNCSTPANYFHVLRRQIHRAFRKPLIICTPKSLLKHRSAVSNLKDFSDEGSNQFQWLIPEVNELVPDKSISKLVFCSGKVYYELVDERQKRNIKDVAIVRIEQLHPFPFQAVIEQSKKYSNSQIVWLQEEPKNMGAWNWIAPHFHSALKESRGATFWPEVVSRPAAAAPATGYGVEHEAQVNSIMNRVFTPAKK